jgi:hypothetical protein
MFTPVSPRRKNPAIKAAFFLFYSLCLALLLFPVLGCPLEDDDEDYGNGLNPGLIGTWASAYGDKYSITGSRFTFDDGYGGGYAGTISYVTNFAANAGVIIIEYDDDNKPVYYDSFDNYGDPDHVLPPKGNFIGIYYKELKPGNSVQMGVAYTAGGAEEVSRENAVAAFTEGNEGTYMGSYGTYSW